MLGFVRVRKTKRMPLKNLLKQTTRMLVNASHSRYDECKDLQGFPKRTNTRKYSKKTRNFAIKLRTFSMRTFAFYPNVRNVLWNAL